MKKFRFYFSFFVTGLIVLFIFSCVKENVGSEKGVKESAIELRSSGSACSPQTLYSEYPSCTHTNEIKQITFASGLGLYSNSSVLKNLCPNLSVTVTFTRTICQILGGGEIQFVHNLDYNMAAMTAACPALLTAINNAQIQGNLVSFLDLIDHEISMQTEFTLAYEDAILFPTKYLCANNKIFSVKYIKNTCYKWELFLDGPIDRPHIGYKKVNCDSVVCCARSNSYCVDSFINGEPNIVTGTPVNYQKFEGECPLECTHDCGEPLSPGGI
jgi:hypothetical protein